MYDVFWCIYTTLTTVTLSYISVDTRESLQGSAKEYTFLTDTNDRKSSIRSFEHSIRSIINVRDPKTKSRLSMFFDDLETI